MKRKPQRNNMNYPNLPNSHLEITSQPEVKEITNELLKQLQNALKSNTLFTEQVGLSLKGIVRILEVLAYERAIKEYYHIELKPDELLVRVPHNRLNNTEINNLAASSNQGRFNSESDHAIAVLSHYEPKLKELEKQLNADSIYSLKNIVVKNLNFDKATHPNVGDSNLALLMFNMPGDVFRR